jgi:hypothetical protein
VKIWPTSWSTGIVNTTTGIRVLNATTLQALVAGTVATGSERVLPSVRGMPSYQLTW